MSRLRTHSGLLCVIVYELAYLWLAHRGAIPADTLVGQLPIVVASWFWGVAGAVPTVLVSTMAEFHQAQRQMYPISVAVLDSLGAMALAGLVVWARHRVSEMNAKVRHSQMVAARAAREYRAVLDATPDFVALLDIQPDGCVTFRMLNSQWTRLMGISEAECRGKKVSEVFDQPMAKELTSHFDTCISTGEPTTYEAEREYAVGRRVLQVKLTPLINDGRVVAILSNGRDVTDLSLKEQALREANAALSTVFDSMPLALVTFDSKANVTSWNPAARRMYGWDAEEVLGKRFPGMDPSVEGVLAERRAKVLAGLSLAAMESKVTIKNGDVLDVRFSNSPLTDRLGRVTGYLSVCEDITEQKRAERELISVNQKLSAIIDCSPLAIVTFDASGVVLSCSNAFESIFGWKPEEVIGSVSPLVPPGHWEDVVQRRSRLLSGETLKSTEVTRLHKHGYEVQVRTSMGPLRDASGKTIGYVSVIADVTAEFMAEKVIRRQTEEMRALVETAPDLIARYDRKYRLLYVNPALEKETARRAEDLMGASCAEAGFPPDIAREIEEVLERVFSEGSTASMEMELTFSDLVPVKTWLYLFAPSRGANGEIDFVTGVARDITPLKRAQQQLLEEKERLRITLESIGDGVIAIDANGKITTFNTVAGVLTGWSEREALQRHISEVFTVLDEATGEPLVQPALQALQTRSVIALANHAVLRDRTGTLKPIADSAAPIQDGDGRTVGAILVFRDVTAERSHRLALEESEQRYRVLVRNLPEMVIVHKNGRLVWANDVVLKRLGVGPNDTGNFYFLDFVAPLNKPFVQDVLRRRAQGDEVEDYECEVVFGDGVYRTVIVRGAPISYGNQPATLLVLSDISERKRTETALRQSEKRFQAAFDSSPAPMAVISMSDGTFLEVNTSFIDTFGYTRAGSNGLPDQEITTFDRHQRHQVINALLAHGRVRDAELELRARGGRKLTCLVSAEPIDLESGHCLICSLVDISSRKQAEEEIRHISYHDALTGVYNRAYCEEHIRQCDTPRQLPVSIVMADVNGLKLVNDAFGHEKGDELLRQVSQTLRAICRAEDTVTRWAGDEFLIVFPKTTELEAQRICDRIRLAFRRKHADPVQPSVALGIATKSAPAESIHDVIKLAEDRMYRNKMVESRSVRSSIVSGLLRTLGEKTYETSEHIRRLSRLVEAFGRRLGLRDSDLDDLALLATMHDIGKIALPDEVLTRTDPLDKQDWDVIRRHPEIGYRIAQSSSGLSHIADAILSHHERWDGKGYPRGLRGVQVPLIARVISIADAFEAMTGERLYRKPMSIESAIKELLLASGSQFDPELVRVFVAMVEEGETVSTG